MLPEQFENIRVTEKLGQLFQDAPTEIQERIINAIVGYQDQIHERVSSGKSEYEIMGEIYDAMDLVAERKPPQGKEISCRRGCAFCCHVEVHISELEAKAIWEYVRRHDIEVNLWYLMQQREFGKYDYAKSEYSACVFLKNNECSIYPFRPLNCRKHTVVSDPDMCDTKKHHKGEVLWFINIDQELIAAAVFSETQNQDSMPRMLLKTYVRNENGHK